jgi:hypothetical protein
MEGHDRALLKGCEDEGSLSNRELWGPSLHLARHAAMIGQDRGETHMTDIDKLQEAVEAVGRFDERKFAHRSHFHLVACGGCGCPAFQQPCSLCRFYPMGADKGTYSPNVATKEMFCSMVERSGPGGRDGTIATWHAVSRKNRWEDKNDVALAASHIDVPSAAEFWDAVVVDGRSINRPSSELYEHLAWSAIGDIGQLVVGGYSNRQQSTRCPEVFEAIRGWIRAVHAGDRDAICEAFEKLEAVATLLTYEYSRNGNLRYARENLSKAIASFEAENTAALTA